MSTETGSGEMVVSAQSVEELVTRPGVRKCHARSKQTGKPCGRWAILGGFVCRVHGGSAEQVQNRAKRRLRALIDPAISVLTNILEAAQRDHACTECGGIDEKRLPSVVKTCTAILDRAGFGPKATVELVLPDDSWMRFIPKDRADQMRMWITEAREMASESRALPGPGPIVDALGVRHVESSSEAPSASDGHSEERE